MTDKIESTAANSTRPKTVIERNYRAGVEELWELWTTKEGFESWWGPEEWTNLSIEGFTSQLAKLDKPLWLEAVRHERTPIRGGDPKHV